MRAPRAVLLALTAALLLLAGCGDGGGDDRGGDSGGGGATPRPITSEEAERLAVMRFRNVDAGTRSLSARYEEQGHRVEIDGWFDYGAGAGYGVVSTAGAPGDAVVWDDMRVAIAPEPPDAVGEPPSSFERWSIAPVDPQGSAVGSLFAIVAGLGADRPENPLLLQQGGALWLRTDRVGDQEVTVFAGPTAPSGEQGGPAEGDGEQTSGPVDPDAANVRYWLDETGLAHRVEVRVGTSWARIDLGPAEDVTVTPPPAVDVGGGEGSG
ncbi:hypothetical protein [Georgenia alba]|uniref:LppX_LprAFG lipoprotein n=1 Tax=Georgenia alba TaxID=2233858 RepID=A0ABW2Q7J1_9MICO